MSTRSVTPGSDAEIQIESDPELGKRQRNKLDKQQRIVAAATALFQEKGFEDTTTAEIAAEAGIGAGTLYLYVESKEDLLVSAFVNVAGEAWTGAFERVDPAAGVVDQVLALFRHVTDHHEADRRLARAFFKELPYVVGPARPLIDDFLRGFYARLESLLINAQVAGQLDPEVPTVVLAHDLYALWHLPMRRRSEDSLDYDTMIQQLEASLRLAFWKLTPEA